MVPGHLLAVFYNELLSLSFPMGCSLAILAAHAVLRMKPLPPAFSSPDYLQQSVLVERCFSHKRPSQSPAAPVYLLRYRGLLPLFSAQDKAGPSAH